MNEYDEHKHYLERMRAGIERTRSYFRRFNDSIAICTMLFIWVIALFSFYEHKIISIFMLIVGYIQYHLLVRVSSAKLEDSDFWKECHK